VNPDDHGDIRYEIGASFSTLMGPAILLLLGLIFGGIGAGALWWSARPTGRRAPASSEQVFRRVGWAFGAIGILLTAVGLLMARSDAAALRDWPSVDAEVVSSSVVSSTRTGSSSRSLSSPTMYDVEVTFRYEVNGRRYENRTTYGIQSSSPGDARARQQEYAPGSRHVIRYRPGDPNVIRFDMGSLLSVFALSGGLTLMGLVFAGLGTAVARVFGRNVLRQRGPPLA
jgi:hypothetical protein